MLSTSIYKDVFIIINEAIQAADTREMKTQSTIASRAIRCHDNWCTSGGGLTFGLKNWANLFMVFYYHFTVDVAVVVPIIAVFKTNERFQVLLELEVPKTEVSIVA